MRENRQINFNFFLLSSFPFFYVCEKRFIISVAEREAEINLNYGFLVVGPQNSSSKINVRLTFHA